MIRELASLAFLETATNVVFLGPPGVGKTHLACGLAVAALETGHSAMFVSLRELAAQLAQSGPRGGASVVRRYTQPTLLIIDEIGYTQLTPEQAHALFELITARYERRSTLLTSNLTFAEWGKLLGDDVLTSALLDRLLHHAEVIVINGHSYRMRHRLAGDSSTRPSHNHWGGSKANWLCGSKESRPWHDQYGFPCARLASYQDKCMWK